MYKITDRIATHGLNYQNGQFDGYIDKLHKDKLLTGKILSQNIDKSNNWYILDCRELADGEQNDLGIYASLMKQGYYMYQQNKNVVCCCSSGQSRSSAIAIMILMKLHYTFDKAYELVNEKNKICQIDPNHIEAIKQIFKIK